MVLNWRLYRWIWALLCQLDLAIFKKIERYVSCALFTFSVHDIFTPNKLPNSVMPAVLRSTYHLYVQRCCCPAIFGKAAGAATVYTQYTHTESKNKTQYNFLIAVMSFLILWFLIYDFVYLKISKFRSLVPVCNMKTLLV